MQITKKIKLYPVGDKEEVKRVYKFIKDGQYAQYQALNLGMGLITSSYLKCNRDIKHEDFIKAQKELTNSHYLFKEIEFAKGVDTLSAVTQKIKKDFSTSLKNGLAKGERCITNYKRENPLLTRGRNLTFYYELETDENLENEIFNSNFNCYLKWVNGIIFKVILGDAYRSSELRSCILKIFKSQYKPSGSSIEINGTKIMLNLSLEIPNNSNFQLNEDTVVGVDLGIAIPAYCSLNNNDYIKKSLGNKNDFLDVRTKMQAQRRQLQKRLQYIKGGHGRKDKLQALDKFKEKEKNFAKTYNHFLSKNIVDFALKNNAKYINLEDLNSDGFNDRILRNWSYYQLQQFIEYKAKMNNIIVRYVNPYHTSQNCSHCGHWEEGQRISQSEFLCKSCGYKANADFNASRNIAKSIELKKTK